MSELLPCPFCGGEAEAVHEINGMWTVECVKCGALVDGIEAWNTRAPMSYEDLKILLDEVGVSEQTCRNVGYYIDGTRFKCSECGYNGWTKWAKDGEDRVPNYCPNCGARVIGANK